MLDWVYKKAVADVNYYHSDDSLVFEMRQNIVDLIMLAESEAKFMLDGIVLDGDVANVKFHTAEGWTVKFCGETLNGTTGGKGVEYNVQRNVNTGNDIWIELTKGDLSYTFNAKMVRNTVHLGTVTGETLPAGIVYRNDATAEVTANGVSFGYEKYVLEDPEDIIFKQDRYFGLTKEYFGCDLQDLYNVTLTFEVETEDINEDFLMMMYLCVGDYSVGYLMDGKRVYSNGTNKRTVTLTFLVDEMNKKIFAQYQNADRFIWRFENMNKSTGKFYEDMKVTLTKVSYTKDGRMGE